MSEKDELKQLVKELRAHREFSEGSAGADWSKVDVCLRAADAIEALSADNARLAANESQCAAAKPLVWAKIETAPRGGEWFIARTERGTARVVHYADEYDRFPISHDGVIWETPPVEWIPLSRILSAITMRPEAEVRAEAWAATLELAAEEQRRKADHWIKRAHETGAGDCRHPADGRVAGHLSAEASIRALITADISAALDRIKAEGMREAARICDRYCEDDALRAPAGWSEDEVSMWNRGGLDHLMAARDAILAAITEGA